MINMHFIYYMALGVLVINLRQTAKHITCVMRSMRAGMKYNNSTGTWAVAS